MCSDWSDERALIIIITIIIIFIRELTSQRVIFKRALRVLLSLGCHASTGTAQGRLRGTIKKHE